MEDFVEETHILLDACVIQYIDRALLRVVCISS